jgi:hypothetical protein
VEDPDTPGKNFTEVGMNGGIKESELPERGYMSVGNPMPKTPSSPISWSSPSVQATRNQKVELCRKERFSDRAIGV